MIPRLLLSLALLLPASAADEWIPARLSPALQRTVDESPHQILDVIVVLKNQPAAEVVAEQNAAFTFERESLQRRRATASASEAAALNEAENALTLRIRRATAQRLAERTRPGYTQASAAAVALGATLLERYTVLNSFHIKLPAHLLPSLLAQPEVAEIVPNSSQSAQIENSVPALGAPALWQAGYTGNTEHVAIFDTGVDVNHPALISFFWTRQTFLSGNNTCVAPDSVSSLDDFHGHGTHIAGIIRSRGVASDPPPIRYGVAPYLSYPHSYKIACLNAAGGATAFDSDVMAALDHLYTNTTARFINFSFGEPAAEDYPFSARMWDHYAENCNFIVVFPSGNLPAGASSCRVMSPGVSYNGLTVGAWSSRGAMNPSSCPGATLAGRRKPDLAAPGTSINSTLFNWESGPTFGPMSGSSLAAAHISGSLALLAGSIYSYGFGSRAVLINSTDDDTWAPDRGWGYANLQRAATQLNVAGGTLLWTDSWQSSVLARPQFFKGDFSGPAKATLVWRYPVSRPSSNSFVAGGLTPLNLHVYSASNLPIAAASGDTLDTVRKISFSASGPTILAVSSLSPPVSRTSELYALASSAPLFAASGPMLSLKCNHPSSVLASTSFNLSCSINNYGDLDAFDVTLSTVYPSGFSAPSTPLSFGNIPAGASVPAQSLGTVTAPSAPAQYTIEHLVQSASYGVNVRFSPAFIVTVSAPEASPTPVIAPGPSFAAPNVPVDFSAGAGLTDLGHTVEYQFDFGDGISAPWGAFVRDHSFAAPGVYSVRARTRCATHVAAVSAWSNPRVLTVSAVQLPTLSNPGFESGSLGPWLTFGAVSPTVSPSAAYSGSYGLSTSSGSGGVYVDFDGLTPQRFYHFTVRVKASGAAHEGMFWAHDGLGSDGVYSGWRTFSTSQWEQLQINFRATQSGMARLHMETRGLSGGLHWDDVQVTPGWVSDMENGTVSPWIPFGAVTAAPASSPANGLYSLALTGSGGAFYDAVGLVPGRWYHVKARVRVAAATAVRLWLHDTQGANPLTDGWYNLTPGAWHELQLNYQANSMAAMRIHIQANTAGVITYWDDVQVLDGWRSDFDGISATAGWTASGAVSTSACASPLGLSCLAQAAGEGEHSRQFSGLRPGHLYTLRARLRTVPGATGAGRFFVSDYSGASLYTTPFLLSNSWQTLQYSFVASADGFVTLHLARNALPGVVSWDEIELLDGWVSDFNDGLIAPWFVYGSPYPYLYNLPSADLSNWFLRTIASTSGGVERTLSGLPAGQRYHVSARTRSYVFTPPVIPSASLLASGSSGDSPASSLVLTPPLPNQWNPLDLNFTTPTSGTLKIRLHSALSSGIDFDDVQVKEGWLCDFESLSTTPPSPRPWTPFGSNASQPASAPAIGNLSLAQYGGGGGVYLDVPNLTPGRRYQISARARSSAGATAQASLWVHDTAGASATFAVARTPSSSLWDRFTLNFTATSTGKVRIHLVSNGGPASGDIFWDEVRLNEGWTSDFDNGQIFGWNPYGASTQALSTAAAIGPISLSQSAGNGGSWQDVNGLIPNQDYLIVARSRSSQGATNQSILWVHDTTGANQIWSVGSTPSPYGWDERRLFYRANSTGAVRLHLANTGGNGTLYWDDIEVVPVY